MKVKGLDPKADAVLQVFVVMISFLVHDKSFVMQVHFHAIYMQTI